MTGSAAENGKRSARKVRAGYWIALGLVALSSALYLFPRLFFPAAKRIEPQRAPLYTSLCPPNWREVASAYEKKQRVSLALFLSTRRLVREDTSSGLTLWETAKGFFWTDSNDKEIRELPWELASIENDLYGGQEAGVQKDDIVLDCGAHFGAFTRQALDRGARLVVAIEIDPKSIECLERTFGSEIAQKKVIIYPKGVSDRAESRDLYRAENSGGNGVELVRNNTGIVVPLTTIDAIVRELGLSRVHFIKMDIEGSEGKAILGARQSIRSFKPRMAIAGYHKDDDPMSLPRAVREIEPAYWVSMPRCWLRPWVKRGQPIVDIIYFRYR